MEEYWVTGTLKYNPETKRYGLFHENRFMNTGLFNEDKLQVYYNQKWVPTSMKKQEDGTWVLADLPFAPEELDGLAARITKTTSPGGTDYLSHQKAPAIYHEFSY